MSCPPKCRVLCKDALKYSVNKSARRVSTGRQRSFSLLQFLKYFMLKSETSGAGVAHYNRKMRNNWSKWEMTSVRGLTSSQVIQSSVPLKK